jgi:dTDP-4-amino-4,6-dideoxygalactose transaminase
MGWPTNSLRLQSAGPPALLSNMTKLDKPIYVTRPFLPPIEEFIEGLREIWGTHWLTNRGPMLRRYEQILSEYFNTPNICLFNNGTLALQIGLQGMGISGEVITTPFTFVATTHALYWNKIRPVFVDIESEYYTIDPKAVEAAITPWTTAILAVHVYGYPCQLEALAEIARRHNLKLIYDAAHAFGVTVNGKSICHYGDLSMLSFHATKLYHSIEGGMLTFKDPGLKITFDYLKNFGFKNEMEVVMPGTNAKMNEMQALMGILVLQHIDELIERSRKIDEIYRDRLKNISGIKFPPPVPKEIFYNHAYEPIEIIEDEFGMSRDALTEKLKKNNIYCRRYFYPLICDFPCYSSLSVNDPLTIARSIAKRILTLPIYDALTIEDVDIICDRITDIHNTL